MTISPGDAANGLFEFFGAAMAALNIRAIWRDKKVRGFSPAPVVFWSAWGVWNLYYYPSLGQWLSFGGGCFVVSVNVIYLLLIWKYWSN